MLIPPDSIAQTSVMGLPILPLMVEVFFGILGLIIVLAYHGAAINHIIMRFEKKANHYLRLGRYNFVFMHFYTSFFFIALTHICEIIIWCFFLMGLGLMDNAVHALLFAGSCYTTVGFIPDTLPVGWKSLAFFISFSGLFCLAWTTSVMIGMTDAYKNAWNLKYGQADLSSS